MTLPAVAGIRAVALRNNLDKARAAAPGCPILAVVKANAYGHGLANVARILDAADGYAVARFSEARSLRESGVDRPVVVLSEAIDRDSIDVARTLDLQLVIHDMRQIDLLERSRGAPLAQIWLKVDTGMGRLGIAAADTSAAIDRLRSCAVVADDPVLMTHLACADEREHPATTEQLARFGAAMGDWQGDVSIANSAGILGWPDALRPGPTLRYAGQNWIRPGLMLYGVSPFAGQLPGDAGLEPAMVLDARLIEVRALPAGSPVGYGARWVAGRDSRIGIVNVGYADGYPWRLPDRAPVGVAGGTAPVVGRISMDTFSVDVTDLPDAQPGDPVTLWGDQPHVAELAELAGTSPYELLTGVGNRVTRKLEE